jgi:HD-like signal output (HDOD) protein
VLHKDQLIAGHVMKVANSVAYSGATQIVSLEQASARLGSKLLAEITLSVSMKSDVFIVSDFKKLIKDLWNISLVSSIYAKNIAQISGLDTGMIYTATLLHSVGMPVVLQSIAEINLRLKNHLDEDSVSILIEEFHSVFTKFIMEKWELPEIVKSSLLNYLDYEKVNIHQKECATIFLASKFAEWMYFPRKVNLNQFVNSTASNLLDLSSSDIDHLIEQRDNISEMVVSLQF